VNVLLATPDGRAGTVRSVRWAGVVAAASVAVVASASTQLGGAGGASSGLLVEAALTMVAASLAFAADDLVAGAAPATPVGLRARLLARLAATSPVAVLGWTVVVVLAGRETGDVTVGVLAAAAIGCIATATALGLQRVADLPSPGAAGAALTVACLGLVAVGAPASWLELLPPAPGGWVAAILAAAAVAWRSTEEPARS
jgi:hypothetical protein